jgi:hypothetical protein
MPTGSLGYSLLPLQEHRLGKLLAVRLETLPRAGAGTGRGRQA